MSVTHDQFRCLSWRKYEQRPSLMPYIHIGYLYSCTRECPQENVSRSDALTSHVLSTISQSSRIIKEANPSCNFLFPFS